MLTLSNIPNEIYLVALDRMGQDRPASADDARAALRIPGLSRNPKLGGIDDAEVVGD
jgi:hypothetical protein